MNKNEPAFPRTGEGFGNRKYDAPGMTLRDWFAGQALGAVFAQGLEVIRHSRADMLGAKSQVEWTVDVAYRIADAMLAERAKSTPQGEA